MANKSSFSNTEWGMIKDSPFWVQTAITAAEGRMGLVEKRREAKALADFLAGYKSSNALVNAVLAEAKDGKHDVDAKSSLEKVGATLEDIADAVEAKTDSREFDGFNDFLMEVGTAIAEAMGENMLKKKDKISDEEEEALHLIATALRATNADRAKRAADAAAAQRAKIAEQKKAADAARKAAAEKKAAADKAAADKAAKEEAERKLAEMEANLKKMEEERKKREELAKKQEALREARRKRMVEARKKAEAAKVAAEEKAAAEAAKYVVQPGDTLGHIALEKLGSAAAWKKIYEANKDVIKNPSLIYPGQELTIPTE
ncbi:MAG: LysM peptidoglycan-binding domain-containing protein [Chloroflexota bacterium]